MWAERRIFLVLNLAVHIISSKVIGGADQGKTSYLVSIISSNASVLMAEFCTKKLRKTVIEYRFWAKFFFLLRKKIRHPPVRPSWLSLGNIIYLGATLHRQFSQDVLVGTFCFRFVTICASSLWLHESLQKLHCNLTMNLCFTHIVISAEENKI